MSEREEDVQRLVFEGFGALEVGDFERALRTAHDLKDRHHAAAFEIEARARWAMEDHEGAIETLEEGVGEAPDQYLLWDYLASFLSDEGRYEEALQAYYRGRECEDAPKETIDFNIAIIYQRQDRHERAIAMLDTIEPAPELPKIFVDGAKAYSLNEMANHSAALELTAGSLASIHEDEDVDPEAVAQLMSEHAYALWVLGVHDAAYLEANDAVGLDKGNRRAAWLIREILDERSPDARAWRVVVAGRWAQPFDDTDTDYGFFATYIVIADSPEETLDYIRPFEPEEVRFTLKIDSAVDLQEKPDVQKGVYEADPGYTFFPLN